MKRAGLLFTLLFVSPAIAHAQAQGGTVTFGGGGAASVPSGASGKVQEKEEKEDEWAVRDRQMNEASTLTGGIGLVHTQHAQGGAPGQFRVGFTTEFMSAGFLCTTTFPCPSPTGAGSVTSDSTDHIGGRLSLDMQVLSWLDTYLATSALANSNNENRPALLQVLGDSVLGAKAHGNVNKWFSAGGGFELWLVNGTGAVGLAGGGTGAKFRGLATADLRGLEKKIPVRISTNLTYVLDRTGAVVKDVEAARGAPITRIERYGLNINRVDHFDIHLGAELFAAKEKVRPFLEYQVAIPVNRQDYLCRTTNPSGDKCLANEKLAPSSLTLGARFFPWKRGFNVLAALDVGVTGVGTFIEEVRPTPPWMLYLGAGWAFDTQDRPPIIEERIVEKPSVKPPGRKVRGFVHEEGQATGVAGAVVSWDNHPELTSLVTGADGRFLTHDLDEGPYVFGVKAEGYKPGQCTTTVVRPGRAAAPPKAAPAAPAAPPPAPAGGEVQLDCVVEALPRVGNVVGHVRDKDGNPVASASVRVVDSARKELTGSSDPQGGFRFEALGPGEAQVTVDADGYLASTEKVDVKARQDNASDIVLQKRPKDPLVKVGANEITIKQQVQFAVDSATILPQSNALLTEIADALVKNPRIKRVEVQGHTDNTGTADRNKQLSEDRASSVVAWLTSHGVGGDRLVSRGFGQSKPLVPNVTGGNRARNRRVQFIILEQDAPPAPEPKKRRGT
jgi:outer membrane protein OmpA-like peptidoglycan-associated protein